jgi:predicted dehydrogenase
MCLSRARGILNTDHFWPPGHIIGYEHTFIANLADFLTCLAQNKQFHPNFDDAVEVEKLVEAVDKSARTGMWQKISVDDTVAISH